MPTGHADPAFDDLKQQFLSCFGAPGPGKRLRVVRAPGRVNLIGEHTDYNEGFVCPMAIEPEVRIVCHGRDDGLVRLSSTAFAGSVVQFSINERITRGEPAWANYSRGVAAELLAAGIPLTGMDLLISNTLPVGGGLSSSAAIEVATALAFLSVAGIEDMDISRLALLCQKAEHEYARVPCGIMDQTIVAGGRAGHAMLLDCRDLTRRFVPIDPNELRVVIVNSMVKHELSGGEYAERRRRCEEATAFFQKENPDIMALRDVTIKQLESAAGAMEEIVFRRARHVVTENARTTEFANQLEERNYERAGELMVQSHASLRDDYEVSTPELDFLAHEAMQIKGVYGARMTGGGFGGCVVALAQPRAVDPLRQHLEQAYPKQFSKHPGVFVTAAAAGASVLE
jgi:galactokinase